MSFILRKGIRYNVSTLNMYDTVKTTKSFRGKIDLVVIDKAKGKRYQRKGWFVNNGKTNPIYLNWKGKVTTVAKLLEVE